MEAANPPSSKSNIYWGIGTSVKTNLLSFATDLKKDIHESVNIDMGNEPNLLGNMAALVRCSKKQISAGPLHREATAGGNLRQRSKRSYTCLRLEKNVKKNKKNYIYKKTDSNGANKIVICQSAKLLMWNLPLFTRIWGALTPLTFRVITLSLHCTNGSRRLSFASIKLCTTGNKHTFNLLNEKNHTYQTALLW